MKFTSESVSLSLGSERVAGLQQTLIYHVSLCESRTLAIRFVVEAHVESSDTVVVVEGKAQNPEFRLEARVKRVRGVGTVDRKHPATCLSSQPCYH